MFIIKKKKKNKNLNSKMLKKNKNGKIVILTTHYMDEADILGDRIAIMAEGDV